ncbi:hypothetical protein DPX16_14698 [Anabarilius grahami]|uniref:Uncharacterized protein n=1 Tax=Anabarilius grahami TaxID=495550 RepID=A0A3N0XNZ1_ANAGA|nr:hypothetical protein DPX16_14698 [Anabarilius grahami]
MEEVPEEDKHKKIQGGAGGGVNQGMALSRSGWGGDPGHSQECDPRWRRWREEPWWKECQRRSLKLECFWVGTGMELGLVSSSSVPAVSGDSQDTSTHSTKAVKLPQGPSPDNWAFVVLLGPVNKKVLRQSSGNVSSRFYDTPHHRHPQAANSITHALNGANPQRPYTTS